eukprot:c32898_g1_i1 orf=285-1964(-)
MEEGGRLTLEQRERVARQKEMAVARRAVRSDPYQAPRPWSLASCAHHHAPARLASTPHEDDGFGGGAQHAQQHELKEGAVKEGDGPSVPSTVSSQTQSDTESESQKACMPSAKSFLKFSKQQIEVLIAVAQGKSVFITGSAGTGKSYILGFIVRFLRDHWGPECVYVTASTGLAACAVGGTTLHSFAGIGLGTDDGETMAAKAFGKQECRDRWRHAKVLIIDEISMIDGDLFDKLDYVARAVRNGLKNDNGRCFGGIQLIVTGDFFQLPPVKPGNPRKYFAFEADCWDKCFDLQIELKHAFRQSDERLVGMLNEIRKGCHTAQTLEALKSCFRVLADDASGISATRLYPLKVNVREENMKELRALANQVFKFSAHDSAASPIYRAMLDSLRAEKELELCVGAQVMLIKNFDTEVGFVNGAKGVVVGFDSLPFKEGDLKKEEARLISPTMKWPVVRFACNRVERIIGPEKQTLECGGMEVAKRVQVPLILAWALSVHKCQGMTLERVETDLSKAFDYGMVYVALSRVKNLEGLQLLGFDPTRIKVHPNVVSFYHQLTNSK